MIITPSIWFLFDGGKKKTLTTNCDTDMMLDVIELVSLQLVMGDILYWTCHFCPNIMETDLQSRLQGYENAQFAKLVFWCIFQQNFLLWIIQGISVQR